MQVGPWGASKRLEIAPPANVCAWGSVTRLQGSSCWVVAAVPPALAMATCLAFWLPPDFTTLSELCATPDPAPCAASVCEPCFGARCVAAPPMSGLLRTGGWAAWPVVVPEVTTSCRVELVEAAATRFEPLAGLDEPDPPQPATAIALSAHAAMSAGRSKRYVGVDMATSGGWGEQHVHPIVAG